MPDLTQHSLFSTLSLLCCAFRLVTPCESALIVQLDAFEYETKAPIMMTAPSVQLENMPMRQVQTHQVRFDIHILHSFLCPYIFTYSLHCCVTYSHSLSTHCIRLLSDSLCFSHNLGNSTTAIAMLATDSCLTCPAGQVAEEAGMGLCKCIKNGNFGSCHLEVLLGLNTTIYYDGEGGVDFFRESVPFVGRW